MNDFLEEVKARHADMTAAIRAVENASDPRDVRRHWVWLQLAADHAAWACEDYFVLSGLDDLDGDVRALREMRVAYERAVREWAGSAF